MPVYQPGVTFSDVPAGHWAEADIAFLYERGLVAGYPDGTLKPDQPQSRVETIVFMARNARESERIVTDVATRLLAAEQALADVPGQIAHDVQQGVNSAVNSARQMIERAEITHPQPQGAPAPDNSPVNSGNWHTLVHRITPGTPG